MLGNVPIILVDLKIILSDFPVVWRVLRVTESARKNVEGMGVNPGGDRGDMSPPIRGLSPQKKIFKKITLSIVKNI